MAKHFEEIFAPDIVESLKRIENALVGSAPANKPGEITFNQNSVQPPGQFYFTQGMQLRVRWFTSMTNEQLTITPVFLVENRLVELAFSTPLITSAANTTVSTISVTGFLLSCSVVADVSTQRGQTYCLIEVLDQTGNLLYTILANYVSAYEPVAYPPISIIPGLSGTGWVHNNAGLRFGNDWWIFTCNAPIAVKIHTVNFQYITDANVADRYVYFRYAGAGTYEKRFPLALTAGNTYNFSFSTEGNDTPVAFVPATWRNFTMSIPPLLVVGGGTFNIKVDNAQVGDDFNLVSSTVEQFYGY